jgi:class 3 adenylate cyclase
MNENISASIHGLNENDLRQVERYATARNTAVLVLFFTDMKSSSALKQRVTEVANEPVFHNTVKKEHDDIIGEVIRRDGHGAIIKDTGDGFFAVFAEPSTAVERALEIQAVLHGHPTIAVRIGMDMGQVIVQSSGGLHRDLFGRHVDWASRAMSLAGGGHVIITKAVATDAEGFINKAQMRCKRHGLYVVKPGESAIEVFEPYNANITQPMPRLQGKPLEHPSHGAAFANLALRSVVGRKWPRALAALLVLFVVVLVALLLQTGPGSTVMNKSSDSQELQRPSADYKPAQVALIEGTTWRFSGTNTTVEFLKGGSVRFNNVDHGWHSGGHWQQWGNFIRFDADNFTIYEVSVSDDRMTGRYQKADEQGKFSTTALTRMR